MQLTKNIFFVAFIQRKKTTDSVVFFLSFGCGLEDFHHSAAQSASSSLTGGEAKIFVLCTNTPIPRRDLPQTPCNLHDFMIY